MRQKENPPFGAGISSMLMLFVILCLTVFGVLAYVTARADYRLTQRSATTVQSYYTADAQAEELLAHLDSLLLESEMDYTDITTILKETGFSVQEQEDILVADMEIDMEDARTYHLQIMFDSSKEYTVTLRQVENQTVWEDETLDVWDGQ